MFKYHPLGDAAFLIKVGDDISPNIHRKVRALKISIQKSEIKGIQEIIPAYNELMICYQPKELNYNDLLTRLKKLERNIESVDLPKPKVIQIPVCYDKKFAPDIEIVAQKNKLLVDDVIQIHTSSKYLIYMLGFTPGFCYLGGLNKKIATPRKDNPRERIEAGSVGIAGNQTGIYPIDSPGGWQIIGKTPLKLFNPENKHPFLLEAGNYIKFESISVKEFEEIAAKETRGQ
jgi:inhibitor of KinA